MDIRRDLGRMNMYTLQGKCQKLKKMRNIWQEETESKYRKYQNEKKKGTLWFVVIKVNI